MKLSSTITLSLIVLSSLSFGAQERVQQDVIAKVTIDHGFSDISKVIIQAKLCNNSLHRAEVWEDDRKIYAKYYHLKPMFHNRKTRQVYYVMDVLEPGHELIETLKKSIDCAWDEVQYAYKGAKTSWHYYGDNSIKLLRKTNRESSVEKDSEDENSDDSSEVTQPGSEYDNMNN